MFKTEAPCNVMSYLQLHTRKMYKIQNFKGTMYIFCTLSMVLHVYLQQVCSYIGYPLEAKITQKTVLKAGISLLCKIKKIKVIHSIYSD